MQTSHSSSSSKTTSKLIDRKGRDATAILKADHKAVDGLFKDYEAAKSHKDKKEIVANICKELTIHAQIEEEIFYPAFQKALKDHELVPEATVEHGTLKDLIADIQVIQPNSDLYDARVKVLSEYVKHHVKEEESEMFPKAKESKLDLDELGNKLLKRKEELIKNHA